MKRLVLNKFYGGISSDPNVGGAGSSYNAENIDVHSNSKRFRLSKSYNNTSTINTRSGGKIIAAMYENNVNYLELSADGYLGGLLANDNNGGYLLEGDNGSGCNLGAITRGDGVKRGFMIASRTFSIWDYQVSDDVLGYERSSSTNDDPSFNTPGDWTIGTNWTVNGGAIHTAGSTESLTNTVTTEIGVEYRLATRHSVTAGSCDVNLGGETIYTLTTSNDSGVLVGFRVATAITEDLEFVPSSDFEGSISSCFVIKQLATKYDYTFDEKAPYLNVGNFIYVGNGNKITEIDCTLDIPVFNDVLEIDRDYTIVGMSNIADQFYIYTTNGSNGRQYIWDGVNTTAYSITWVDKPIQNIANFGNIDYIITGTTKRQQISVKNGYQLEPLIVTDDFVRTKDRIYINANSVNAVETIGNRLLLGGDGGIYSFGNKTPGLSKALIKEFCYPGGSITNMFYSEALSDSVFAYFSGYINNGDQEGVFGNYKISISLEEGNNDEDFCELEDSNTGWYEINDLMGEAYSNIKKLAKYNIGAILKENTFMNTYITENDDEQFANLYFPGRDLGIEIGDVYTYNSRTFTVLKVINSDTKKGYLLHCSYAGDKLTSKYKGLFTRTSGTGSATIYVDVVRYGYRLLNTFTDITKSRFRQIIPIQFHSKRFVIEIGTFDEEVSPEVFDFNLYYNETNDE